jgi:hypothetical protein
LKQKEQTYVCDDVSIGEKYRDDNFRYLFSIYLLTFLPSTMPGMQHTATEAEVQLKAIALRRQGGNYKCQYQGCEATQKTHSRLFWW